MRVKKNLMLWVAVFALALPLLLAGTASAKYMSDGAVPDGLGGWKTPNDGICVVGLHADGTMDVADGITSKRDCIYLNKGTMNSGTAFDLTGLSGANCTTTAGDGAKHAVATSGCWDASGNPVSLKGLDRTQKMCEAKGGIWTASGGTKCVAYGWQYRGQDATGTPYTLATAPGFCYARMNTTIAAASCPSTSSNSSTAFGYRVTGTLCQYDYGVNGPVSSALTKADGSTVAALTVVDLTAYTTMGTCLANGGSWSAWIPAGTTATIDTITGMTFDLTRQAVNADEGCLHCHSTVDQANGPAERWKDSYLKTGHKNMLRKVVAGSPWAGPDANGNLAVYTTDGTNALDFNLATYGSGTTMAYIYGDWMAANPTVASVSAKYGCGACHTAGFNDATNPGVQSIGTPGYAGQQPADSGAGYVAAVTAGHKWDLEGIQCSRCHNATVPSVSAAQIAASGFPTTYPTSGGMGNIPGGPAAMSNYSNFLCFGCHQSMGKTWPAGTTQYDPTLIPTGISHGAASGRDFNGHVLGNSFLNSVHSRWTGTVQLNSLGKYDLVGNGTYASAFQGFTCWQSASSSSPAKTKADGTEIKDKATCEGLYGAGAWRSDGQGSCTTCHDVHQSLYIAGQEALRKECVDCHQNSDYASAVPAATQYDNAKMAHPQGAGTPWDTALYGGDPCAVCHMAIQAMKNGNQNSMPVHVWRINTSAAYNTFPTADQFNGTNGATKDRNAQTSPDGSYTQAVWVDLDLACGQCHGGSVGTTANGAPSFSVDQLAAAAAGLHTSGTKTTDVTTANNQCLTCHSAGAGGAPIVTPGTDHHGLHVACTACHTTPHQGQALPDPTNNTFCLTCHTNTGTHAVHHAVPGLATMCVTCHAIPGVLDATKAITNSATIVNANCQSCHATAQGTKRALILSGTGDNHHNGSGTSTARSVAGCLYCHDKGKPFGDASTEVMQDQAAPNTCNGACHAGTLPSAGDHHTGEGMALTNGTYCLTCHVVGGPIQPGGTDPALYEGDLTKMTRDQVNAYCQTCHATAQGSFRAIIPSGTGDNHHNGSSTSTARSVAGCLYCHGEVGGVKFGTATTEVMMDAAAPNTCNGSCHSGVLPSAGDHHTGVGLALTNNTYCLTCHTVGSSIQPGGTDPALYAGDLTLKNRDEVTTYCLSCHATAQGTFRALIVSGTGDNHHRGSSTSTARSVAGCLYCHGETGGVSFGGAATEVVQDSVGMTSPCLACHSPVQSGPTQDHHAGDCVTCHNGVQVIYPGANDPTSTIAPNPLVQSSVTNACQACHATAQGSLRAIVPSGAGDNHHNGSGTTTARSVAGCLYCHGEVGGIKFGGLETEVMVDQVAAGSCSGACHASAQATSGQHHTGAGLALTNGTVCLTCHEAGTFTGAPYPGVTTPAVSVDCAACHNGTNASLQAINHPSAAVLGATVTERCEKCHDSSGVIGGITYTNYAGQQPTSIDVACGQCHGGSLGAGATTNGASFIGLTDLTSRAPTMHGAVSTVPTAIFSARTDTVTDYKVLYDASATVCPSADCTYSWSTGETGVTSSHTFADATPATITLSVASTGGNASASVSVTPKYVGSNSTQVGSLVVTPTGNTVNASYNLSGGFGPYTVKATWGDGSTGTTTGVAAGANTASHTYANAGTYTVTITAADTGMNGIVTTNSKTASVTIAPSTLTISGLVTRVNGTTPVASASVTLKLNGVAKKLVYTNASGNYTITGVAPGTYTATVAKSGVTFANPAATIPVTTSNVTQDISSTN